MYGDELSDFFEDRILDNYSTDAQDGSCREVADKIVRQFAGGIPSSSSLELAEAAVVPKCRRVRAREALPHRPSHLRGSRRGSRHRPSPRAPRRLRRRASRASLLLLLLLLVYYYRYLEYYGYLNVWESAGTEILGIPTVSKCMRLEYYCSVYSTL